MFVLSNNKFLALFTAMMVACSFVDAAGVRSRRLRQDEESQVRFLKSTKAGGGFDASTTNTGVVSPPIVATPINTFGEGCPTQQNGLNSCLAQRGMGNTTPCYTCIKGLSKLSSATVHGLRSCSNPVFNGGFCMECYDEVLNFFNCATGKNLGAPPPSQSGNGSPAAGGSGGGTVANPNAGGGVSMPSDLDYAPDTMCPFTAPESGDDCDTENYKYLECYFPGQLCTCRYDSPRYNCVELD